MSGNKIRFSMITFLLVSFSLKAEELIRLDNFGTSDSKNAGDLVHLYMTENCSVCKTQIEILRNCIQAERVSAYMGGKSEDKLRTYVRRKKIPFKTYLLNETAKKKLSFNGKSPALAFSYKGNFLTLEGLHDCDKIISTIKSDNLGLHK